MKENVFITGASGWIGSRLLEKMLINQFNITALIRKKNATHLELELKYRNLHFIESTLEKVDEWKQNLSDIDVLIHLAAKVHTYSKTKKEALDFDDINHEATKKIFIEAENFGVKRGLFISSIAVKDLNKEKENKIEYAYATSKLKAERFLIELNKTSNMLIKIVRPVTLYGGEDKGNFKKLYNLSRFNLFPVIGNGKNLKTIIYYDDFAESLLNIVKSSFFSKNEILTIGTETISMNEIAQQFKKNNKNLIVLKIPIAPLEMLLKILNLINKKMSLKLSRQLNTLSQSNVYELDEGSKYLPSKITLFKNINLKNEYIRNELEK